MTRSPAPAMTDPAGRITAFRAVEAAYPAEVASLSQALARLLAARWRACRPNPDPEPPPRRERARRQRRARKGA